MDTLATLLLFKYLFVKSFVDIIFKKYFLPQYKILFLTFQRLTKNNQFLWLPMLSDK